MCHYVAHNFIPYEFFSNEYEIVRHTHSLVIQETEWKHIATSSSTKGVSQFVQYQSFTIPLLCSFKSKSETTVGSITTEESIHVVRN